LKAGDNRYTESGKEGSNNRYYNTGSEVGHHVQKCPNKRIILAAWKQQNATAIKFTEKKEKQKVQRQRCSHGGSTTGSYGGSYGGKHYHLPLATAMGIDNDNASLRGPKCGSCPKVQTRMIMTGHSQLREKVTGAICYDSTP